jgi:hypothetical protein
MIELNNFYNDGFGWICRRCERESAPESDGGGNHSRLLREGEAESKTPRFSSSALARWVDNSRTALVCPRCAVIESVDKI